VNHFGNILCAFIASIYAGQVVILSCRHDDDGAFDASSVAEVNQFLVVAAHF